MIYLLGFLLFVALGGLLYFLVLWFKERRAARRLRGEIESSRVAAELRQQSLESELGQARAQAARLSKWSVVEDADAKAREIQSLAQAMLAQAESDARILLSGTEEQCREKLDAARLEAAKDTSEAKARAKTLTEEAQAALATATSRAAQIIAEANERAEQIAGKAYDAVRNAELYERTARAMRNIIEGYGDEYLVPAEMRAIRTKVARIETIRREKQDAARQGEWLLKHRICACLVVHQPGMASVRPEHTHPETYRDIQETLAWARGDYSEAERLAALDPDEHVPPPPGTPWEEQMRLARVALDRTFEDAGDSTERVRVAVTVAAGAHLQRTRSCSPS